MDLKLELLKLAEKWDSAEYAIEQVNNPLLPQEQCAIEIRDLLQRFEKKLRPGARGEGNDEAVQGIHRVMQR